MDSHYSTADIVQKLMMRVNARSAGNFAQADALRDDLIQHGIYLADRAGHITAAGPTKQSAYDTALAAARVCAHRGADGGHGSPVRGKDNYSPGRNSRGRSPKNQSTSPRRGLPHNQSKKKLQHHHQ